MSNFGKNQLDEEIKNEGLRLLEEAVTRLWELGENKTARRIAKYITRHKHLSYLSESKEDGKDENSRNGSC